MVPDANIRFLLLLSSAGWESIRPSAMFRVTFCRKSTAGASDHDTLATGIGGLCIGRTGFIALCINRLAYFQCLLSSPDWLLDKTSTHQL